MQDNFGLLKQRRGKIKNCLYKNSYTFPIKEDLSDINSIGDWKRVSKIFKKNKEDYLS